jgi:hypothetical protein
VEEREAHTVKHTPGGNPEKYNRETFEEFLAAVPSKPRQSN